MLLKFKLARDVRIEILESFNDMINIALKENVDAMISRTRV